jgi:hypothetical protein
MADLCLGSGSPPNDVITSNTDNINNANNHNLEDNLEDNFNMPNYEEARQEGLDQREADLERHHEERQELPAEIQALRAENQANLARHSRQQMLLILVISGLILVNFGLILALYHC